MIYDSDYSVRLATLGKMGGDVNKKYDSVYEIDLEILRLTEQGGGGSGATYTAGANISIDSANTISALGYVYDATKQAFAEGYTNTANSYYTHAEGQETKATNNGAHAEGRKTTASSTYTHAEGYGSTASQQAAHAEGYYTNAAGYYSHAEGSQTKTTNNFEHAEGHFNKSNNENYDSGKTLHSVGIGSDDNTRKNAFEIMSNGDAYMVGLGGYDGTNFSAATRLQDTLAQVSLLTQAEYDALVQGGTVNSNTLYIITDAQ